MTDWKAQTEQLVNTWTDAQKRMWDGWFSAMNQMNQNPALRNLEDERKRAVGAWEESVRKGYEAQAEWLHLWASNFSEERGTPAQAAAWAQSMHGMMTTWADSQREMSTSMFELAKRYDSSQMGAEWEAQSKRILGAWQEAAERAMQAQNDMTRLWSPQSKDS